MGLVQAAKEDGKGGTEGKEVALEEAMEAAH